MSIRVKLLVILVVFMSASIEAIPPEAAKSIYFKTEAAGFVLEQDEGVMYYIDLSVRKNIRREMYGTALFENPLDSKSPLVFNFKLLKGDGNLTFRSPIIREITNEKPYQVQILLYKDIDKTELKNTHVQFVEFIMPSAIAIEKGIKFISSKYDNLHTKQFNVNGWSFSLEKSEWHEASRQINIEQSVMEYIPSGEVLDNWSLKLTSHVIYTHIENDWMYNYLIKELKIDCPSFSSKVLEASSESILFEWSHSGCRGNPPQHEIRKLVNSYNYLFSLAVSWKETNVLDKQKQFWIYKIESAQVKL